MTGIVAISKNWFIGKDGTIPWHSNEDLKFFKEITLDKHIVVGAKTFHTLPKLPRRTVWFITSRYCQLEHVRNPQGLYGIAVNTLPSFNYDVELFLCGGAQVYRSYLPSCSSLFLTLLDIDADGDTRFPYSLDWIKWYFPKSTLIKKIVYGNIYRFDR